MTLVGENNIRQTLHQDLRNSIPPRQSDFLQENSSLLSEADKIQPLERARTTTVRTIKGFKSLYQKVLETATEEDGTNYPIRFVGDSPPVDAELPCFTVKLKSRRPYSVNGRKELAARPMPSVDDPEHPGDVIEREFRRQENMIEITAWAKSGKERDDLAEWVESVFFEYLWAFQWAGLAHPVLWEERGADITKQIQNQTIHGAPVEYRVQTGAITSSRASKLRHLAIKIGIYNEPED